MHSSPVSLQVLTATPPPLHLDVAVAPEAWMHGWLAGLPLHTLRIEQGLDLEWGGGNGAAHQPACPPRWWPTS